MIEWTEISDDDFIAEVEAFTLRAEQMDEFSWWWAVYIADQEIASSWDNPSPVVSEKEAKEKAEEAITNYKLKND